MKKYKRISQGFKNYKLFPIDQDVNELISSAPDRDYYSSLYTYNEDDYKVWEKTGSVAGITGVKTKRLVFDFDSKTDLEVTRTEAMDLCSRLVSSGIEQDNIQIYFSGSKGFHVELNTTDEFTRTEYENILENLAGDLSTLDRKVTDEQRIFRLPLTKHPNTGLYKIPITLSELSETPLELIKEDAQHISEEHKIMMETSHEVVLPEKIKSLKDISKISQKTKSNLNLTFSETLDLSQKPKWISAVRYALMNGFFPSDQGLRNKAFMILAATFKSNGFPKEIAYRMLKGVAELQAQRYKSDPYPNNELWNNVTEVVYSHSWKGGIYSDKTDDFLVQTAEALNLTVDVEKENSLSIDQLKNKFITYAENSDKNTIKTGIAELDENVMLTTGMMVGLLAAPSAGKTSIAYNITENVSRNNELVLFHSLDMFESSVYARLLGKHTGLSMKQILKMVLEKNITKNLEEAFGQLTTDYKNVMFDFRTGLTVEDIEQSIIDTETKTGNKIRLLVIDYLEKIAGPYSDATANSAFVASKLSDLAKKYDLCLLLLLQPQKSAGDPSQPLLSMRNVKGASVIEQDCRLIITLSRPGFNPQNNEDDLYMSVNVVKNNMGGVHHFDMNWNGIAGTVSSMNQMDKEIFEEFRNKLEQEKKQRPDPFGNSN